MNQKKYIRSDCYFNKNSEQSIYLWENVNNRKKENEERGAQEKT